MYITNISELSALSNKEFKSYLGQTLLEIGAESSVQNLYTWENQEDKDKRHCFHMDLLAQELDKRLSSYEKNKKGS